MTIAEALKQTAEKHGLGSTLVTGHAAKYWVEAMKLYGESCRGEGFEASKRRVRVWCDKFGVHARYDEDYEEYAAKNPLK